MALFPFSMPESANVLTFTVLLFEIFEVFGLLFDFDSESLNLYDEN